MAIQAQVYQENLAFPWIGGGGDMNAENQSVCGLNLSSNQSQFPMFQQKHLDQQQRLLHMQQQQLQLQTHHPQTLSAHISQQDKDFDHMLHYQNQRLRMGLQEQRTQQMVSLMKKVECKAQFILSQKDEEIARAAHRTAELHDLVQKMEMERQAWQRVAQENEAMVASLNNTMDELMRDRACSSSAGCEATAESCCNENRGYGSGHADYGEVGGACMSCNTRGSCMLFLPCRHLSSCKECEAFLGFCPVCKTAKKATVEALIS